MMNVFEWIVWFFFLFITVVSAWFWLVKRKETGQGKVQDRTVAEFVPAFPRIFVSESLILVFFLLVDFNRLNLLWIYPWVWSVILKRMRRGK